MKRFTFLAVLAAGVLAAACNKADSPGAKPPARTDAATKPAGSVPAAPALDAKSLITDDKVARYIVYQKEMNTVADLVMRAATQAYGKSGQDQKKFEKELSKDERTKKIADTQASALSKSGLTQAEYVKMIDIIIPYTAGVATGTDESKKTARAEFYAKHGPEILAVLDRHQPELLALQDEMLAAALKKK